MVILLYTWTVAYHDRRLANDWAELSHVYSKEKLIPLAIWNGTIRTEQSRNPTASDNIFVRSYWECEKGHTFATGRVSHPHNCFTCHSTLIRWVPGETGR